jgi:hypothetical protein
MNTGGDVEQRNAGLDRRAARHARNPHHAAQGRDHHVVAGTVLVGPRLTEGGHRAVDEALVVSRQGFIVQSDARHVADPEVLDDHVKLADEASRGLAAWLCREVDDHALLATVERKKIDALALDERRTK